jgi:predicted site-specific integrase-resolvase
MKFSVCARVSALSSKKAWRLSRAGRTQLPLLVAEQPDRLARFGPEDIESALAPSNRRIVIVNYGDDGRSGSRLDWLPHFVVRWTPWKACS